MNFGLNVAVHRDSRTSFLILNEIARTGERMEISRSERNYFILLEKNQVDPFIANKSVAFSSPGAHNEG